MRRYLVGSWSLVLAGILVIAPPPAQASITTLDDALASAYVNNRSLDAERALLRATDEKVPQARAAWRPVVAITATQGISHCQGTQERGKPIGNASGVCSSTSSPPTYGGSANLSPETYGMTITQPIYHGGGAAAEGQALDLIQSERAKLASTEQKVLLDAVTDYMDVVFAQAELDLNRENVDVVRHQWDITREQARVGEVTDTDVKQAEAALADALAQRDTAEGKVKQSASALAHDIGAPPGLLRAPDGLPTLPGSRDATINIAARQNPDVLTAKFAELATEQDVHQIRGELLPSFSVQASIGRDKEIARPGLQEDQGSVIAQLSVPLYEGGDVYSRSREAQQTAAEQRSLLDDARLQAMESAAQSWDGMVSANATITALKNEIDADAAALDGVQHEQGVGARTIQDVLAAEQTLLTAKTALAQARHDAVVAAYGVRAATGQLTATALGSPVQIYDPEVHLQSVEDKWAGFSSDDGAAPRLLHAATTRPLRHFLEDDAGSAPPSRSEGALFGATGTSEYTAPPPAPAPHQAMQATAAAPMGPVDFDHSSDPSPTTNKWMDSASE